MQSSPNRRRTIQRRTINLTKPRLWSIYPAMKTQYHKQNRDCLPRRAPHRCLIHTTASQRCPINTRFRRPAGDNFGFCWWEHSRRLCATNNWCTWDCRRTSSSVQLSEWSIMMSATMPQKWWAMPAASSSRPSSPCSPEWCQPFWHVSECSLRQSIEINFWISRLVFSSTRNGRFRAGTSQLLVLAEIVLLRKNIGRSAIPSESTPCRSLPKRVLLSNYFSLQFLFSSVYVIVVYYLTSQPMEFKRLMMFVCICVLISLVSQSLGLLIGAGLSVESGVFLGPVASIPTVLFSGFFVNFNAIPGYLRWLTWVSYVRYGFEGEKRLDVRFTSQFQHFLLYFRCNDINLWPRSWTFAMPGNLLPFS